MKSTGIVRRIDELGRIVIPKEIRKTLFLQNGDALQIFAEENALVLKKFDEFINPKKLDALLLVASQNLSASCLLISKNKILAKSKIDAKTLPQNFLQSAQKLFEQKKPKVFDAKDFALNQFSHILAHPIFVDLDVEYIFLVLKQSNFLEEDLKLASIISTIISLEI